MEFNTGLFSCVEMKGHAEMKGLESHRVREIGSCLKHRLGRQLELQENPRCSVCLTADMQLQGGACGSGRRNCCANLSLGQGSVRCLVVNLGRLVVRRAGSQEWAGCGLRGEGGQLGPSASCCLFLFLSDHYDLLKKWPLLFLLPSRSHMTSC